MSEFRIGLALSGGGARAMAFHLGCLRALHDRGVLGRVSVLSSVSGGSVLAALWAYWDDDFETFEQRVRQVLGKGFVRGIRRSVLWSAETPRILSTMLFAGIPALSIRTLQIVYGVLGGVGLQPPFGERVARLTPPFRRRASRTTAFVRHLEQNVFLGRSVADVARPDLTVVFNATELRTLSAFRYASFGTRSWRYGDVAERDFSVGEAVAASAAFPLLLPSLDEELVFLKDGERRAHRVVITDGGVYDNLGIQPLLPGRDRRVSGPSTSVDFIICCNAGEGLASGDSIPYTFLSRLRASFLAVHRRQENLSQNLLHRMAASGELSGFLLPYLGQQDSRLKFAPADLVPREDVADYPVDFSAMPEAYIDALSRRGEQVTHAVIEEHRPEL
ncbi:patatin-like phospholipase family protein [Parvularcula oceani]|uniref:patatin-like phospholipase family protein n=1 Tax=Parvularcula oceani TaxID=1247963 RepID=UPI0004E1B3CA|nr:patatin-like phospholipase family protein [Parvularcula oceani]